MANRIKRGSSGDVFTPREERALLIGLDAANSRRNEVEESVEELAHLAKTAGADVVERCIVRRPRPTPSYFIGKGKAEELSRLCRLEGVNLVVVDNDLSPVQIKNLEGVFRVKILDRTDLILDIFAQHARSREGKIQVELAQLSYLLPRLTRAWTHLSRQEGGIGTRGPGEKQIEVDRRRVRQRIHRLREELTEVRLHRATQRKKRKRVGLPAVSIVGYTNAGKSTLFNALTEAGVLVDDRLFATLDPTARAICLPIGRKAVLSDTVGFIRHLPHSLVEAFKATLEEVVQADVLLHVLDVSHPNAMAQNEAVWDVLGEIGAAEKPVVTALNKIDLLEYPALAERFGREIADSVPVSAREGKGLEDLLSLLDERILRLRRRCRLRLPIGAGDLLSRIYQEGRVLSVRYNDGDVDVEALLRPDLLARLSRFLT